jgi:hypothetical protein
MTLSVDLDNTERCPVGEACEVCTTRNDLVVATFDSVVGTGCMTVCRACREAGELPKVGVLVGALLVAGHCEHLGIDLDQAAAIREGVHLGETS